MKKQITLYGLAGIIIALDQLTKYWAEQYLTPYFPEAITNSFNLTLVYNKGAAFSFLSDASGWQRWFFIVLTLTICSILLVWIKRLPEKVTCIGLALALVLGGAIGNLLDRIRMGQVVDFIDIYYQQWHWPAFNIADSAITIGAIVLAIISLRPEQKS